MLKICMASKKAKFKEQSMKGCDAPRTHLLWEVWDMQADESWDRKVICKLSIFHVLILFPRRLPWPLSEMGY